MTNSRELIKDYLKALSVITAVNLFLLLFLYILGQLAKNVQTDCVHILNHIEYYEELNRVGDKLVREDQLYLKFKTSLPQPSKTIITNNLHNTNQLHVSHLVSSQAIN